MNDSELQRFINGDGNDTTPERFTAQQNEGITNEASTQADNIQAVTGNEAIAHTAQATNQQTLIHKYVSYPLGDFLKDLTPMEYLIDNWIQVEGLHMIFGEPGSYKTFNVIDMCGHIACNDFELWCGKSVEHGGVFYLAGEGVKGLKKRFAGWCLEHDKNPKDIPIHISPEVFTLDDKTPEHNIESTIANIRAVCPNVKLVVVDTLNRYMSGEENSATDMGRFILVCAKLQRELGCAVLIVHHSGLAQDAKGRSRGSGALHGAVDIEIQCVKSGMTCTLIQQRNKENEKDKPISFDMKEIEIPGVKNKKGTLVRTTTLVPVFNKTQTETLATAEPESQKQEKTTKPSVHHKRGVKTFKEAAIRYGRLSTNKAGDSFIDVEIEEWRKVAYETIESGESHSAKRSAFNRARQALIEEAEPPILTRYENEEGTFYRLAHNGENETAFRVETFNAVILRIEEEKKSA